MIPDIVLTISLSHTWPQDRDSVYTHTAAHLYSLTFVQLYICDFDAISVTERIDIAMI